MVDHPSASCDLLEDVLVDPEAVAPIASFHERGDGLAEGYAVSVQVGSQLLMRQLTQVICRVSQWQVRARVLGQPICPEPPAA